LKILASELPLIVCTHVVGLWLAVAGFCFWWEITYLNNILYLVDRDLTSEELCTNCWYAESSSFCRISCTSGFSAHVVLHFL